MTVDDQGRPEPDLAVGELETLVGFLEFHRATLEWKTRGLTDDQLRQRIASSTMTLGGLLMHVAYVEEHWFVGVIHDRELMSPWAEVNWKATPDWEWDAAYTISGDAMRAQWNTSVERSRAALSAALESAVHMIEEYARHNGHADLLREAIDGQTGE
jgi:uncharacterized damage-inducible protein DinB